MRGRLEAALTLEAAPPRVYLPGVRHTRAAVFSALLLITACGGSPPPPDASTVALDHPVAATLLRVSADGGRPVLYHLPDLSPLDWRAEDRLGKPRELVGTISAPPQVIMLDRTGKLTTMRMEAGRTRTVVSGAVTAALSPDGTLYSVDSSGAAWSVGRRTPERYRAPFADVPDRLWAGASGDLVGLDSAAPAVEALGPSDTLAIHPIESGAVAAAPWADLIAVAADTAVWLHDPHSSAEPVRIKAGPGAAGAAFSPSGHQLYVVTTEGRLAIVDRFAAKLRTRIKLPGPAIDVRVGPDGRWVLVRPAAGDSLWVVDLTTDSVAGTVAGSWRDDLPLVTSSNALVTRAGGDVVAHQLTAQGLPESGRIEGAATDLWIAIPWSPVTEEQTVAIAGPDSALAATGDSTPGSTVYLQVSSSRNPEWAAELVQKLGAAGLHASVLRPSADTEAYRVVLGPYASRDSAEATGRTLGMPYFIISLTPNPD